MADTWYVKTREDGVVVRVFVDDYEQPQEGDIQLDTKWYWGKAPGIIITHIIHGERFTVQDGRLVPRYDDPSEIENAKQQKRQEMENYPFSPLLSKKRKDNLPKALQEVEDHLAECINTEEVVHTRLIGY